MPKMRMLTAAAGADFAWREGEVVDVDDETAAIWCDGHRAELVVEERRTTGRRKQRTNVEKAVTRPPEDRAAGSRPRVERTPDRGSD